MVSLVIYFQEINLKFTAFLKTFTFIFLIWTYITYKDMDIFHKSLENKNEQGKILNRIHQRLLAKDELHMELVYARKDGHLLHNRIDKNKKNVADDITISSQLNKKGSNNFEIYMKNYKRRYEKKNGLSKLDCYCEKKIFDKIDYIYDLAKKMRNDKKGFKRKIIKKYGIGSIILSLIPALGLIYYILFGLDKNLTGAIKLCRDPTHYTDTTSDHNGTHCNRDVWQTTLVNIKLFNQIFTFTMITIVLLFLIYIMTKVIKYEKLKVGKGKMRINEYYRFYKDTF
ncbi:Plasmodium exported protein, unknown function [Plasmodium vivax]|uniref:Variable surface protein n=1 Tax=Plasmodium vivax TaxID=5855 RepID=A0A1G4EG27_PLAVI|nr:Plasmodium exported protein, unknown function [Plasmodium vivax]